MAPSPSMTATTSSTAIATATMPDNEHDNHRINPDYQYDIHIDESAPLAQQPPKISLSLKPHQRASLHKAIIMETCGRVHYNAPHAERFLPQYHFSNRNTTDSSVFKGVFYVDTNIGLLGDAIGSGKTMLSLAIVAATPTDRIHLRRHTIQSYQGRTGSYLRATMDYDENRERERESERDATRRAKLATTLIVVPRGPVYSQYVAAIRENTALNVLCIDSIAVIRRSMPKPGATLQELRTFIESHDAVLVKNTALKNLHDYYGVETGRVLNNWDRIIVDEACDILNHTNLYSYKFLWMISATYAHMTGVASSYRNQLSYSINGVLISQETINFVLVKCTDAFVIKSFNVPAPIESFHICEIPRQFAAVHSFLSPGVRERIDANDFMGALTLLGATQDTENNVVTLVTKEIERDIRNKKREIEYLQSLDVTDDVRVSRLATPTAELARLEDKLKSLIERVTAIEEKSCSICMDSLENPLLLPCSHLFCARCLISWMQMNRNTCPSCRAAIQSRQLIAIVTDRQDGAAGASAGGTGSDQPQQIEPEPMRTYSKEDTLVNIIQANPEGRFVVFSKLDSSYWGCMNRLRSSGIPFNLLRGNSNVMASVLDRFRTGETRVLLLNTVHAASGIDISCATDLIIVHDLGHGRTQAVGRCNRHPRTVPLRIHQLCYPHEISSPSPQPTPQPTNSNPVPASE